MRTLFFLLIIIFFSKSFATGKCLEIFLNDEKLFTENYENYSIKNINLENPEATFDPDNFLLKLMTKTAGVGQKISRLTSAKVVDTVVYLASGYEAGFAFLAFPGATTFIGIDNHPFINTNVDSIAAKSLPLQDTVFTRFQAIDDFVADGNHLASAILASLKMTFPELRVHRIAEFKESDGASHGWVDFDTGPGTPIRRYIHINEWFNGGSKWRTVLPEHGFDGLLIKGSIDIYKDYRNGAFDLVNHLRATQGVVLDADNRLWDLIQWGYQDFVLEVEAAGLPESSITIYRTEQFDVHLTNLTIGYDSELIFTRPGAKIFIYK